MGCIVRGQSGIRTADLRVAEVGSIALSSLGPILVSNLKTTLQVFVNKTNNLDI